jgi:hypothetical protein
MAMVSVFFGSVTKVSFLFPERSLRQGLATVIGRNYYSRIRTRSRADSTEVASSTFSANQSAGLVGQDLTATFLSSARQATRASRGHHSHSGTDSLDLDRVDPTNVAPRQRGDVDCGCRDKNDGTRAVQLQHADQVAIGAVEEIDGDERGRLGTAGVVEVQDPRVCGS